MDRTQEYLVTITYKYDMARLIKKNGRKTMLSIMPKEVIEYETKVKTWGKEA